MVDRRLLLAVFVGVASWAALGAGAHASYGARLIADEPQYVLSALSLWEDGDLDIADELAAERWRVFHDAQLPQQTEPRPDGSALSPHDPLLPVLLAPGVGVAGWQGARATMALVAGALAALLVWTAVARFGVRVRTALVVVGAFALSPPLASYGSQIYPELPAAFAVTCGVAAALGPPTRWRTVGWVAAVVALPWLGVKYAPVAATLAAVALWRELRGPNPTRSPSPSGPDLVRFAGAVGALAVAGATYLWFHRAVYGGWTVYAAGDHFVEGELTVVGHDPDHLGRTVRLLGLLVDRNFGLIAWGPVYLLAVPAFAALVTRRRSVPWRTAVTVAPFVAGYATATWVALTMHGWWWPGRQTVVVLPSAVLAVAALAERVPRLLRAVVAGGALGALSWLWLVVETTFGSITLVVDFDRTSNPWVQAWRTVLPDQRADGPVPVVLGVGWALGLAGLAVAGRRSARRDEDALAGEGADADRVAVDLDGGRPVG